MTAEETLAVRANLVLLDKARNGTVSAMKELLRQLDEVQGTKDGAKPAKPPPRPLLYARGTKASLRRL
jgi:hypothetical protein